VAGGTVWISCDSKLAIISDGKLYWVDYDSSPQLRTNEAEEGSRVWFYYLRDGGKVVSILSCEQAQSIDELPQADPIEVEEKKKRSNGY
jgi:hypothetical protein